ncbi:unnamed protein product [Arabis nemorensis]|uniref:Uncharacterized protein n=1 Tax=Arabis nemorensis TaxID=586526 RepID=A0A565B829_9BRAS|nr:unnamed protein product [Arabis nemorensis]
MLAVFFIMYIQQNLLEQLGLYIFQVTEEILLTNQWFCSSTKDLFSLVVSLWQLTQLEYFNGQRLQIWLTPAWTWTSESRLDRKH